MLLFGTVKNITITLDPRTATWARKRAAEQGMSLSRFLGTLLERTMRESREYERAMRQFLSRPPRVLGSKGAPHPTRDQPLEPRRFR